MTQETLVWLSSVDWIAVLMAIHFAGLALAVLSGIAGHGLAVNVLLQAGPRPSRGGMGLMHAASVVGLALLWLSGGGVAVLKLSYDALPQMLLFKLVVVTVLSINFGLVQEFVLALLYRRRRPVAAHLSWLEMLAVALIGGISVSCWMALAGTVLVAELAQVPMRMLFGYLAGLIGVMSGGWLALMVVVRLLAPASRSGTPSVPEAVNRPGAPMTAPPVLPEGAGGARREDRTWRHRPAAQPRGRSDLAEQLRQSLAAQESNDNARRRLNEQMQQERLREARSSHGPTEAGGRAGGEQGDDDDRLLFKWLRGTGAKSGALVGGAPASPEAPAEETLTVGDVRRACRRALLGAGAVSFVSNMLMLTGPLFMLQIYDRVLTSKSLPTLSVLFTLVLALFMFMGVLDLIRSRLLVRIGLRFDRLLGPQVFSRALEVADGASQAERVQLQKDVQHIRQFVSGAGTTAIFDIPWAPLYFAIVVMFHWALGVVALAGAVLLVVLSLLNELFSRKPVAAAGKLAGDAEQLFEAGRRNSEILQAMGMAPRYRERWLEKHSAGLLVTTKAADIAGLLSTMTKTVRLVLQSAMLAMGAYLVLAAEISPGVMIASSIIMSRALAPIELAISHWRGFIAARQGMSRLQKEFATLGAKSSRLSLPTPEGRVQVENMFAAPIGLRDPILKGLNFQLKPGDALGVLGPSGSGKSTLARVLVGVWPTLRGRVALDGAPLEHWPPEQLGQHIGYLPQDAAMFNGTVADNIARFDARAEPAAIIAAAECANVHKMILGLGEGYNTRVGEGGAVLSGGQRQRIALARALYGQPALVVLDEPNSNLDSEGEAALADAIRTMREAGRTVVVMAHRRKALEHVNFILVLKEGRQATFGPKQEILRAARNSPPRVSRRSSLHAAE